MPKADELHYKLVQAGMDLHAYAVQVNPVGADQMKATARRSIAMACAVAERAGDYDLLAVCRAAEGKLGN